MTKAACRWASSQYNKGIIGTNRGQGWKIAKCDISHAKCSGISLVEILFQPLTMIRFIHTGLRTIRFMIAGRLELSVLKATHRRLLNTIVFTTLTSAKTLSVMMSVRSTFRQRLGLRFYATAFMIARGIWLGGKVEDTQISRNVFYNNSLPDSFEVTNENREDLVAALGEDIEIKDSMGVTLIDNNFLLSDCALKLESKGVLLVHNLINGSVEWLSNTNVAENDPYYHRLYQQNAPESAPYDSSCFYNNVFIGRTSGVKWQN